MRACGPRPFEHDLMASLAHPGVTCDGLRPMFGGAAPAVAYFLIQAITGKPPNFGGEG